MGQVEIALVKVGFLRIIKKYFMSRYPNTITSKLYQLLLFRSVVFFKCHCQKNYITILFDTIKIIYLRVTKIP